MKYYINLLFWKKDKMLVNDISVKKGWSIEVDSLISLLKFDFVNSDLK